ncbi:CAP domain-containing protein [Parapedobacter koreensis]|uniref:Cysteine-rich secretory protein family protein n=1 Tax=Parapedobacter koreensis TaxID=332977 RepID=A0A1H7F410_9SPHI|nr:CAP domain-containing protein [Parapedobacter koreensis]SEK18740.1 Cysteine-rich secretory protein family protein [Parapedobacter koreensis]
MLKYLTQAAICLFVLVSACEPNSSESLEPVPTEPKDIPSGKEDDDSSDTLIETDSTIILALAEVNALRQKGCNCGDQTMPSTSKVTWNAALYAAALAHAKDMQLNDYFNHTSPSGENVYHRLIKAGYISTSSAVLAYGENIAFGKFDTETAVQKWFESPSHCANLMRDTYKEMAIAHDGNYWVQVFGAKRE